MEQLLPVPHGGRSQQLCSSRGLVGPSTLHHSLGLGMQKTLYAHKGDSPEPSSLPGGGAVTADPSMDLSCIPDSGISQHLPRELSFPRLLQAGSMPDTGSSSQTANRLQCLCRRRIRVRSKHGNHLGWLLPTLLQHPACPWLSSHV